MTRLAEFSIRAALEWLHEENLIVVGMGKLGGGELNVSSDIDLVFVHPDGEGIRPIRSSWSAPARKLIALLNDVTEDGFVFRVDMRLRPYGDSGALVSSFDALEAYFVAQGREWERYAWIKARAVSGSDSSMEALEEIVRPFVYRKYLDYGTLEAMRRLHAEVRRDVARRELAEHVKLGPGGIREIEFIAQALQLVRGGRDPELTARPTLLILDALCQEKTSPRKSKAGAFRRPTCSCATSSTACSTSTTRRRTSCPSAEDDRARLAQMADFSSWEAFYAALNAHRERGDAPLPGRVRGARGGDRAQALARASAPRRAARGPALPAAARRFAAPLRCADPGARAAPPPRRPIRRRRWRAASTCWRRSRAAPPTSRCSPSGPRRWSASRA